MNFTLDVINILVVLVALINAVYGLIAYSRNRKDWTNFSFFILTLTVSAWGLGMFAYRGFQDLESIVFFSRMLYLAAAAIPISFLYFVFVFPHERVSFEKWQKYLLPLPFIFVAAIAVLPNMLIEGVHIVPGAEHVILFNQKLHFLYGIYIMGYFFAGYVILLRRFFRATGLYRIQILYIFVGTFVSTLIGVTANLIFPFLGNFSLNWLGQVGVIVMIAAISYAIFKHHLFNIRVIATEIFVVTLWIFIFIRTFISENFEERLTNAGLLALTIIIGILLIRSVEKEVKQREKIEKQASELERANTRLSEFMSFASHEIRGPLTAMRGIAANILDGDYGEVGKTLKTAVQQILIRGGDVVALIGQYLNKAKLELGELNYNLGDVDLKELLRGVVASLLPSAEQAEVGLHFNIPAGNWIIHADKGKIQEVLYNLVDNAIKYSPKGRVWVYLERNAGTALVKIADNGIGISKETMPLLFQKFGRAAGAGMVNIKGSGLGLYLAREFITAHKGKIWVESAGEKKGSTFFIELPLAEIPS